MTRQEYQKMKQKEISLEKLLANIREKTREFDNEENRKQLNGLIGRCFKPSMRSKALVFKYDENDDRMYYVEANKEDNEICVSREISMSSSVYIQNEISREDFLKDYNAVLANIEAFLNIGFSITGEKNDNM